MNIEDIITEMQNIQNTLLEYLDDESNVEENFQNLINLFSDHKITESSDKFEIFLKTILKISNYHQRESNFFNKIEKIMKFFKNEIENKFSNQKIFNIFKSNKRILLFLMEEKMLTINSDMIDIFKSKYANAKYIQYFQPEIKQYFESTNKKDIPHELLIKLPEDFEQNRKIGENESDICKIIRNDSIKDFISYVTKNSYSLNAKIKPSIYETNRFLIKKIKDRPHFRFLLRYNLNIDNEITLINYAAFFGSIQIFKYLQMNGVQLTDSLWDFAIHGQNNEIIGILEDNNIIPSDKTYKKVFIEAIKCYHNDMACYIQNNHYHDDDCLNEIIKKFNFSFIHNDSSLTVPSSFFALCKYNYATFVYVILQEKDIDINSQIIFLFVF